MRLNLRDPLLLLLIVWAGTCRGAAAEVRLETDLPYKTDATGYERERCKLDLHLPAEEGFPVVVWFHGGGLRVGEKNGGIEKRLAKRLVEAGIGCACVNYRLSPQSKFPTYVEDAAAAVAWVAENIADYGGDPRSVFVSGHSAGGYLTAIVGVDPRWLRAHGMSPNELRGLLPISGQLATHTTILEERGDKSDDRVLDDAAPLRHVSDGSPPQLVIAGGNDLPDREQVNRDYVAALQKVHHPDVTLLVVPKRTHVSIVGLVNQPDDVVAQAMIDFINDHRVDRLRALNIGGIKPVHQCGQLLLAGQPSPEDLALLKKRGIKTILSVRHANEIDWDEAAAATKHDMQFVQVPFRGKEELTDAVFDQVLSVLRNKENGPTAFHCGSANRVGAIWYVHRVLEEGVPPAVAEREAKQVGLRNLDYLKKAQDYVQRHGETDPANQ